MYIAHATVKSEKNKESRQVKTCRSALSAWQFQIKHGRRVPCNAHPMNNIVISHIKTSFQVGFSQIVIEITFQIHIQKFDEQTYWEWLPLGG